MRYAAFLVIPLILLLSYGGCGSSGGGSTEETLNRCFSELSENPCFDPNEGGTMTNVDDKSAGEVIEELENREDFIEELEFDEILRTRGRSIFLPDLPPDCTWEDSGLVIKTANDWDRYRENCYFEDNFFDPPDVDFSQNMLIVSLDGERAFGTEIVSVLEFESELVAVITDTVPDASSSEARFYGSFVAEVPRRNVPVSFIRMEKMCNTVFNFSNSECLAESMLNSCEGLICSFVGGRAGIVEPICSVIDCSSIHCKNFDENLGNIQAGTINDLHIGDGLFPEGFIDLGDGDREVGCSILVE